jgi:hypothetical protein
LGRHVTRGVKGSGSGRTILFYYYFWSDPNLTRLNSDQKILTRTRPDGSEATVSYQPTRSWFTTLPLPSPISQLDWVVHFFNLLWIKSSTVNLLFNGNDFFTKYDEIKFQTAFYHLMNWIMIHHVCTLTSIMWAKRGCSSHRITKSDSSHNY